MSGPAVAALTRLCRDSSPLSQDRRGRATHSRPARKPDDGARRRFRRSGSIREHRLEPGPTPRSREEIDTTERHPAATGGDREARRGAPAPERLRVPTVAGLGSSPQGALHESYAEPSLPRERLKRRCRTRSDAVPGRLRNPLGVALRRRKLGGAASRLIGLALCGSGALWPRVSRAASARWFRRHGLHLAKRNWQVPADGRWPSPTVTSGLSSWLGPRR
jgi:hypothetical protein